MPARRFRCSGCGGAKPEDDFSGPQLRADGNQRVCLECERRAVIQAKNANEGGGAANNNFISPIPGQRPNQSNNTTQSSIPPPPISPYRPQPNKESDVPTKITGPNVHAPRGMFCIGCKQAKEDFSATMIHAHHTKRMCVDCERKFGTVPPPQIQKQVEKSLSRYSPTVNRSVGDLVNQTQAQANQQMMMKMSSSASRRSPLSASGMSSSNNMAAQQYDNQQPIDAYDIAVDVGGTNTDIVLLTRDDEDSDKIKVIETCKEPTTVDITTGIVKGVKHVLASAAIAPQSVRFVFIGTTTFTNALVERSSELAKVAVLRLGGDGVSSIKPFSTLPQDLQRCVAGDFEIISGGFDCYGNSYLPLDRQAVSEFCNRLRMNNGPFNIVINGCFSPIRTDQEDEIEQSIRSELAQMIGPDRVNKEVIITKASDVAGMDLILREHAAICNAALRPLASKVVAAFYSAFNSTVLPLNSAKVFLTQNDGTILTMTEASKKPILTIGSGPTNSLVGATLLAKAQGLIPQSVQGNLSFEIVAASLPLLQRTRHVAGYQYNPYEAPELVKIKERLIVKLGKSPPNEEEKRNCEALGFYQFAPNGQMNSDAFVQFMITAVKCKLSAAELKDLFNTLDVGGTRLIACDIGGTTSDLGIVERSGFPRVSNVTHNVGGVKINSRCPDTVSIGLGGGSHCNVTTDSYTCRSTFSFGPKSVGYNIGSNRHGAKCFGGPQLTATDVAVALGHCQIPGADANRVRNSFARLDDAKAALETMKRMLDEQIALVKTENEDIPLVLIGGGACLFPSSTKFNGTKDKVIRPLHAEVANAVGAAVARVGADLDEMVSTRNFPPTPNNSTIELIETHYKKKLIQKCAASGALADTVVISDWSLESVGYIPDTIHVRGRALGKMNMAKVGTIERQSELNRIIMNAPSDGDNDRSGGDNDYSEGEYIQQDQRKTGMSDSFLNITRPVSERPTNIQNGVWSITPEDVELISLGASLLGCGGGGETFQGRWRVLNKLVNEGKQIRVISPRALDRNRHVVFPIGFAGAPTILVEMLGSGNELGNALRHNMQLCEKQVQGKQVVIMSAEIGGCNGVEPLVCAAKEGCYIVDADCMGRAFPKLSHTLSFHAPGASLGPIVMTGAREQVRPSVIRETSYDKIESSVRDMLMNKHAGICGLCLPPLNVEQCGPEFLAHGSLTLAHRIGVAIHNSRVQHADPVTKILSLLGGKLLFSGVIIGNDKTEKRGFSCGVLRIKDPHNPQAGEMKITYINENITAQLGNQYVATSPDCISVVDSSSGEGIFCSQYKYGVRVAVLSYPCHQAYRTNGTLAHETSPHKMDKDIPVTEPVLLPKPRGAVVSFCDQ